MLGFSLCVLSLIATPATSLIVRSGVLALGSDAEPKDRRAMATSAPSSLLATFSFASSPSAAVIPTSYDFRGHAILLGVSGGPTTVFSICPQPRFDMFL